MSLAVRDSAVPRPLATPERICELDGVRGVAIILVLIWHYVAGQVQVPPGSPGAYALRLVGFSWGGVDLFFVLSGYLVGGIMMRSRVRGRGLGGILIRRLFRIVPLYTVSLLAFLAVRGSSPPDAGDALGWLIGDAMPIWSYATMTQNVAMAAAGQHGANWLGITWSLALEIQFYVVLAVVIFCVQPHRLTAVLIALSVAALVLRVALAIQFSHGGFASFLLVPSRLDSICFGVLAADVVQKGDWTARVASSARLVLTIILLCFAIVVALCTKGQGIGSLGMVVLGHLLLATGSALLIVLLMSTSDGRLRCMFRAPLLVAVGTISYGIYVLHQPISGLLHHFVLGQAPRIASPLDLAVTGAALLGTLALSCLSWHGLEQPMIELGRRLTTQRGGISA